jgi:Sigma-70, region 4
VSPRNALATRTAFAQRQSRTGAGDTQSGSRAGVTASGRPEPTPCGDCFRCGLVRVTACVPVAGELSKPCGSSADIHATIEARAILQAINCLPATQRAALLSTILTAQDQAQLAARLGSTPAAVRQLVRRARVRLRRTIGGWIPYFAGRSHDLVTATATSGASHAGAVALAVAAVISPPVINQPLRPSPPPSPVTMTRSAPATAAPPTLRIATPAIRAPRVPKPRIP